MTCPSCNGERQVWVTGVHPSRHTRGDMTSPDEWLEWCERCEGTGVVDDGDEESE